MRILIGFRNGPHHEPPSDTVTHAGLWGDGLLIGGRDQRERSATDDVVPTVVRTRSPAGDPPRPDTVFT